MLKVLKLVVNKCGQKIFSERKFQASVIKGSSLQLLLGTRYNSDSIHFLINVDTYIQN
jgi:hypothetical protein